MSGAAVTLRLRTTDGDKFKLMMMRGGGNMFGKLGGGEDQESGVAALTAFLADR